MLTIENQKVLVFLTWIRMPPEDNQNEIEEQVLDNIFISEEEQSPFIPDDSYLDDLQSHISFNEGQTVTLHVDGDTEVDGAVYIS